MNTSRSGPKQGQELVAVWVRRVVGSDLMEGERDRAGDLLLVEGNAAPVAQDDFSLLGRDAPAEKPESGAAGARCFCIDTLRGCHYGLGAFVRQPPPVGANEL
jgi:hypothetical protein